MSTLEKVPWISKDEWEFCRDNLFGENVRLKKKALEHLYIWKVRCTNLPIAVECSLILMDVHLKGCYESAENEMFTNTMNYESWYSVAIMRFLNLITDSNVGGKASSSMNQLAKRYEIPEWIVDIRHAVAHGPLLPSLCSLKEAVEKCLDWLYESYWSKNMYEDSVSNQSETTPSSTFLCFEICLSLKKYLSFGFENTLDIPVPDREKIGRVLSKNLENPSDYNTQEWSLAEIHKCVLKKLGRHLKKNTNYGKRLISSILETDQYLLSRDAVKNNELSKSVFNFWSDVLFVICDSSICYHFLLELINIVNSPLESLWRQQCAALYLNEILKRIATWQRTNLDTENAENYNAKRKKVKRKTSSADNPSQPSLNDVKLTKEEICELIQTALKKPNKNVKIFLKILLSISNSPEYVSEYDKLIALIDIFNGSQLDGYNCVETDNVGRTIQELAGKSLYSAITRTPERGADRVMIVEDDDVLRNSVRDESDEWKNAPLGLLPWQVNFQPWLHIYDSE